MTTNQPPAEIILESIERAFSACLDNESEQRLNEMWEAPEMATARDLTEEAGISWDFESWQQTVELIQGRDGQWARLWEVESSTIHDLASESMLDRVHASSIDPAVASALFAEIADTREEADARIAEVLGVADVLS